MQVRVKLPKSGMGIEEGTLARWLKQEGSLVAQGEVIAEVETAKAIQEIEAPVGGKLVQILVQEQQTVPVNTALAVIDVEAGKSCDVGRTLLPKVGVAGRFMTQDRDTQIARLSADCRNLIGGECKVGGGSESLIKLAPRDGNKLAEIGSSSADDVDEAVSIAKSAFEDKRWAGLSIGDRQRILRRWADLLEQHLDDFALFESVDVGKPITGARTFDVPVSIDWIRSCASALDHVTDKVFCTSESSIAYQLHRPLGVVGAITGWNFPLLLATQKIAPALAMGNSVVLKPSEVTPLSAPKLVGLALEAGVPEGVINVIQGGRETGAHLAKSLGVDLLSFTGSTRTGRELLKSSGDSNMKRLLLECGGKAPGIVFDDCPDLQKVADTIVRRAFWNQGQVCTAISRLLVHKGIRKYLVDAILERASRIVPQDPLDEAAEHGALVSQTHKARVLDYIESGLSEGARPLLRVRSPDPVAGGYYLGPVILDRVEPRFRVAREEIFGPVLSILDFADEDEAIEIANGTIFGLSATIWTQNLRRAHRMTHSLRAGSIVVNATAEPRGGPGIGVASVGGLKQSGIGVEGGIEGLREYASTSTVQMYV